MFPRRTFLQIAALGAVSLAVPAVGEAFRRRPLKKGYMLNAFPRAGKLTLLEKFKLLKAAGFDGVEPNSHLDREDVLKARDATGLEIASISCGDHTRMFAHAAPSERRKGVEGLIYAIESAHAYGAKSILVVAGGVNENVSYADNYQRSQEAIREALPHAERLGVVLAIENVWNHFLLSPLEAARFVDEFGSPAVGWHFDIGNVMSVGWPEHWIRVLGARIRAIHVKEFSRRQMNEQGLRKGFNVEYLEGDNRWPSIMKALDEIRYTGWAILEPACSACKEALEPEAYLARVSGDLDRILAS